jgi:pimeloyl-ACP methyl ester carboxylesterase
VLDLPAHGRTSVSHLKHLDLADALIEICGEMRIENPILVGHSFGALAAAVTAVSYPEMIYGVMAIDPYLNNREMTRQHKTVEDAMDEVGRMTWPWKDASDVDAEVDRCVETHYSPRHNEKNLKAMVHRGYRLLGDGTHTRYPRREDEMKGVEANWTVDVGATFNAIDCPLSIAVSIDSVWNLEKRRENLAEIARNVRKFESVEFQCRHDIPGYQPERLSNYIISWSERIANRNIT